MKAVSCDNDSAKIVTTECVFVRLSLYLIAFCSRPEIATDVMSDMIIDPTGVDVDVKSVTRSSCLLCDGQTTTPADGFHAIRQKRHSAFCIKKDKGELGLPHQSIKPLMFGPVVAHMTGHRWCSSAAHLPVSISSRLISSPPFLQQLIPFRICCPPAPVHPFIQNSIR